MASLGGKELKPFDVIRLLAPPTHFTLGVWLDAADACSLASTRRLTEPFLFLSTPLQRTNCTLSISGHLCEDTSIHLIVNSLPTIGNSLKKQKSLYKVLTPSIKPTIYILMGAHDAYMRHWLVKG